jgi:hypothetical protein
VATNYVAPSAPPAAPVALDVQLLIQGASAQRGGASAKDQRLHGWPTTAWRLLPPVQNSPAAGMAGHYRHRDCCDRHCGGRGQQSDPNTITVS